MQNEEGRERSLVQHLRNAGVQEDLGSAMNGLAKRVMARVYLSSIQLTTFKLNCCDRNLPRSCRDVSNGTCSRGASPQVPQETQVSFCDASVSYMYSTTP